MEALGIKWTPRLRAVSELKHWDKNPRKITEVNYARLKRKVLEEGMHQVLTIDVDDTVLSGNQRLNILVECGIEQVWCMEPERALTEEERDKVGLQSNLIEGMWDNDMLANNFDIPMLLDQGFTKLQLGMNPLEEDDFDADKEMDGVKPIPQLGDIYTLGQHRIMCGDSTSLEDVQKLMDGQKAHLVFTDPPYMVDYHSPAGNTYKSKKYGGEGGGYLQRQPFGRGRSGVFHQGTQKSLRSLAGRCLYLLVVRRKERVDESIGVQRHWLESLSGGHLDKELDGIFCGSGLSPPVRTSHVWLEGGQDPF